MTLSEACAKPFEALVCSLYDKNLKFRIPFTNDTLRKGAYIGKVTEMYVFAELFEIRKLKSNLIDGLFTWGKRKPLYQIPSFAVIVSIFKKYGIRIRPAPIASRLDAMPCPSCTDGRACKTRTDPTNPKPRCRTCPVDVELLSCGA